MIDQRSKDIHQQDGQHHSLRIGRIQYPDQDGQNSNQESIYPFSLLCLCGCYRIRSHENRTEGETDEFDETDILRIVEFVRSLPDQQRKMRAGGKTAIVGIKGHAWGRLRQYKAWSETIDTSWQVQVFNDVKEALDWLEAS